MLDGGGGGVCALVLWFRLLCMSVSVCLWGVDTRRSDEGYNIISCPNVVGVVVVVCVLFLG